MVRKGNLAVFESTGISETGEAMPTKIGVHACYIKAYLHIYFEIILINYIFDGPWTIVHGRKGNLAVFESTGISETGEAMPTKIVVHACYIKAYLHIYFETILINYIF